jgi:FkbM family methyltransferase
MFRTTIADALARLALRAPPLERALVAATRNALLRRHLRLGAVALGYPRVLVGRELRIAEMDRYRFYVNVGESLGVEPYFFRNSGAVWLTRSLIRQGDVCVDAGANAGHYTFLCASIVGTTGRVFAFEANPEFAELIRRSKDLNVFGEIVHVDQRALDSVSGAVKRFFVSVNPMNSGTSSLVDHGWYVSSDCAIDVETIAFDDFARDAAVDHFRLVKIDVERAEESVIVGASHALGNHRIDFLIVELHAGSAAQRLIEQAGYAGYLLLPEQKQVVPVAHIGPGRFGDFLFVRPGLSLPA